MTVEQVTAAIVDAIEADSKPDETCHDCGGSGRYYGHGAVVNGVFKGFTGPCYRCQGTGVQTDADRKRNWGYDNFHRRISV